MNKITTITIIAILALIVIAFGIWWSLSPSDVLAPVDDNANNQEEVNTSNEEPSGQFVQQAPANDSVTGEDEETEEDVEAEADNGVTISMDDTGFSPETITVPVGTKVTFINNGQALHWPASDNHPTHNILPEFDSKNGLSTGESFSYTFNKAGEWEYHDHLKAQLTGVVIVE